jgi:hypothetical protein
MTRLQRQFFVRYLAVLCLVLGATGALAKPLGGGPVYLYVSPTTERYMQLQNSSYFMVYKRWCQHLQRYGDKASEVTREQLLGVLKTGVLILPASLALDAQERAAIVQFAAKGGSWLDSGLLGTRDAQVQYVGLDFLHNTFRVQTHGFFPASDDAFFIPYGDGPLTWPIPAGRRMSMDAEKDSILRLQTDTGAAVLMDWSRTRQADPHTVLAFDEQGDSRLAYFSFPESAWPYSKDAAVLMDATIAWLRHQPQAYKAAWSKGYVASHLIEMDTEDQFFSAPSFATDLESDGFKGAFYCFTSLAVVYPEVVRDLIARGHEIAYHADVHYGFKGDAPAEQELRIRFMKQQMQSVLGERVKEATGFRAPTESYDTPPKSCCARMGFSTMLPILLLIKTACHFFLGRAGPCA